MDLKLFDAEYKLMCIVWENENINSTELVKTCECQLGWKKSTTYTVVRKLKERGILSHQDAVITSKVKQQDVLSYESNMLLNRGFDNSLPMFLTAFLGNRKLSKKEADELMRIIEGNKEHE